MADNLRTILQIVLVNDTGDSCYRMRWPGRQLAEQAPDWRIINLDANAAERFLWGEQADLLVLYQSHDLDLLPVIERRRSLGKKTLVEYNDNFYAPPPSSPVSKEWGSPLLWQIYETFMHQSDGVIVTGTGLEELFRQRTGAPLHIMENHMPEDPPPFAQVWPADSGGLQIGWAGSLGHMPDLLALAPVLQEVLALDSKITLHIMGNASIPEMLELPAQQLRFTDWGSMEQYLKFWEPVQIGLAPLIDTPYNRCRSDVKALEMSSRGTLPILTAAAPYRTFFEKTETHGVQRFGEFVDKIRFYLEHRDALEADARRCHAYVSRERVGPRRRERLELYRSMLAPQSDPFQWPIGAGYHELMATAQNGTAHARVLAAVSQSFKEKNYPAALAAAAQAVARNPHSADFTLLELRALARTHPAAAAPKMEHALARFPEDLRFRLLQLALLRAAPELTAVWEAILDKLQSRSSAYQAAFEAELAGACGRQLRAFPSLEDVGEQLLQIYSGNAELKFALAFHYARTGRPERAYMLAAEVGEARRALDLNQRFLSSLELSFLRTWTEALKARSQGGF